MAPHDPPDSHSPRVYNRGLLLFVRAYQLRRSDTSTGHLIFLGICSIAAGPISLNIAADGVSNLGNVIYYLHHYGASCLALASAYYYFRALYSGPSKGTMYPFAILRPHILTEKGRYYRRMFFLFLGLWFLWVAVGGIMVWDYDLKPK